MQPIPDEIFYLLVLFEQELKMNGEDMAIVRAYRRYMEGESLESLKIPKEVEMEFNRLLTFNRPDHHSKEYIGFAGKANDFWDKADKMTPEEKKAARQTQWASAMQDAIREQDKRQKRK